MNPNSIKKVGKHLVTRAGNGEPKSLDVSTPETNPKSGSSARGPPLQVEICDDLIWGTQAIADEIGRTLSETQYLVRKKRLPIGRLGPKLIFASRRQLRRHFTSETQLVETGD